MPLDSEDRSPHRPRRAGAKKLEMADSGAQVTPSLGGFHGGQEAPLTFRVNDTPHHRQECFSNGGLPLWLLTRY